MALKPGALAPDFTLASFTGNPINLREVLRGGQHALLVFLRHLG
jgi:peroxiredoxin